MRARLARWPLGTGFVLVAVAPQVAEQKPTQLPAAKPAATAKPPAAGSTTAPPAPPLDWKAGASTVRIPPSTRM